MTWYDPRAASGPCGCTAPLWGVLGGYVPVSQIEINTVLILTALKGEAGASKRWGIESKKTGVGKRSSTSEQSLILRLDSPKEVLGW